MRILHVVTLVDDNSSYGGPLTVAINQCRELRSRGHDAQILAGWAQHGAPDSIWKNLHSGSSDLRWPVKDFPRADDTRSNPNSHKVDKGSLRMAKRQAPQYVMNFASLAFYRLPTLKILQAELGDSLRIISGSPASEPFITLIDREDLDITQVRNIIGPKKILIQWLPWHILMSCSVLMMDLNPRVVHVWFLLLLRRLRGQKTILWGHAFPRAGRGARSDKFRGAMRRLATGLVTYTETQALELSEMYPNKTVVAATNALYFENQIRFNEDSGSRNRLIYVGRLSESKKPDLLIPAFRQVAAKYPSVVLTIVGDGELAQRLQDQKHESGLGEQIEILGPLSKYRDLQALYDRSIASLSPGYLGLSAIQSFSFGVPMLVSRDEPHSPEIEAATEGQNTLFFTTDDATDLARAMSFMIETQAEWQSKGPHISQMSRRYSVDAMAAGLLDALTGTTR